MGLKNCEIQLDNPWNTYYAGQTLNGQVKFTFDSPKKIRGIVIRFLGEANTAWNETEKRKDDDGRERDETINFTGHEEYFQFQSYLLGGKNSAEIELPAGEHVYPFSCPLPPTLPSSFEGEWGHVRYTIKITLDRPWKFDQDTKMAFTVVSPVDLNQNPRIKDPVHLDVEKSFCCFCCRSGPLQVIVKLPVSGYCSGQSIPAIVDCDNASNVTVTGIRLQLRKVITFQTNQPRVEKKKSKVTICDAGCDAVAGGASKTWSPTLEIPALPPSNLINCSLIDLDYEVKLVVEVGGPHRNLEGKIPIVLGTIPLVGLNLPTAAFRDNPPAAPTSTTTTVEPQNGGGGAMGWNVGGTGLYPEMPPPTFAEGQFRATINDQNDSQHTMMASGTNEFAPRYPILMPTAPPLD